MMSSPASIVVKILFSLLAAATLGAAQTPLPAGLNCFIGTGFSFDAGHGCNMPPAMESLPVCDSTPSSGSACIEQDHAEDMTNYVRDVRSSSDHDDLMSTITNAEGGGFGVSVSVGVSYMKQSHTTESSVAYFVGASGQVRKDSIRNPVDLKLSDAAKTLLQNDPEQFLSTHGLRYVYSVVYGGSFLGSYTMNSRSTASASSLGISAKFSASDIYYSAGASENFNTATNAASEQVSIFRSAQWRGGTGISLDPTGPMGMGNTFRKWNATLRSNPEPLLIVLRKWIDSADVQAIVGTKSAAIQKAFDAPTIMQITRDEISKEYGKVLMAKDSASIAQTWVAVKKDTRTLGALADLERKCIQHILEIETMDEASTIMRQTQLQTGNFSWFIAGQLQNKYDSLVANLPKPTGAVVWSTVWGATSDYHTETWDGYDTDVQAVFFASGARHTIKNGMIYFGGKYQDWSPMVDASVQAAWVAPSGPGQDDGFYIIKDGKVCGVPWGGSGVPCVLETWDYVDETVQAAWVFGGYLYIIREGRVWVATWGTNDFHTIDFGNVIDESVITAWVENGNFYVLKPAQGNQTQVFQIVI